MRLQIVNLILVLIGLPVTGVVIAQDNEWFTGPEVKLISQQKETKTRARVILGDVKKIRSNWEAELEIDFFSPFTQWLYQFPRGSEIEPLLAAWQQQFSTQSAQQLRLCEGRQCGSSSFFANEVFDQRTLYGRDDNQAYSVWYHASESKIFTFYAVVRGNRTVQVLVRAIEVEPADRDRLNAKLSGNKLSGKMAPASQIIQEKLFKGFQLKGSGDWDLQASEAAMSALTQHLQSVRNRTGYLVVYWYKAGDLPSLQNETLKLAQTLRDQIQFTDFKKDQLIPVGGGPLRNTQGELWVEWLAKPE